MSHRAEQAITWLVGLVHGAALATDDGHRLSVAQAKGRAGTVRAHQRLVTITAVSVSPVQEMRAGGSTALPHDVHAELRLTVHYPDDGGDVPALARQISDMGRLALALQSAATLTDAGGTFPVSSTPTTAATPGTATRSGAVYLTNTITARLRYTEGAS